MESPSALGSPLTTASQPFLSHTALGPLPLGVGTNRMLRVVLYSANSRLGNGEAALSIGPIVMHD